MDRPRRNPWRWLLLAAMLCPSSVLAEDQPAVDRRLLDASLALGKKFLLDNQLADGSFRYCYHLATGEPEASQSQVRQAGALWGVALIHQDQPAPNTRDCVLRGLAFFQRHSQVDDQGRRWVIFPGANGGASVTVALVTLAIIDFLRAEPAGTHPELERQLDQYLAFLASLRRRDQLFYKQYVHRSGEGVGLPSPYFDGEILLAMVKAARYRKYDNLRSVALETAQATYHAYVEGTLQSGDDSDQTKGFFQWGSMSYAELFDSGWPGTDVYARRTIALSQWMIDIHRTLERSRNTGYAYEGIISAYHLAESTGDRASQQKFRHVCEQGLGKLLTWQVGSPVANPYLQDTPPASSDALGGVLNAADEPWLRIDVTQHQMHAVILARRYIWLADGS